MESRWDTEGVMTQSAEKLIDVFVTVIGIFFSKEL